MKPIFFSQDVSNDFLDRDQKKISIAIDSLQTDPTADLKVFVQLEPPSVKDTRAAVIANQHSFDLILAWHPDILDNCDNAKKFIFGSCWIDSPSDCWENKKDEVSFLTSNKAWAPGHKIRQAVFEDCEADDCIAYYTQNTHAKYSIIIENEVTPNWITEKLIDCFITKTIPIYWGAPNVGEYFDEEGILPFSSLSDLERILNTLSSEEYTELEEAIEKNYNLARNYMCFHSRVDKEISLHLERSIR